MPKNLFKIILLTLLLIPTTVFAATKNSQGAKFYINSGEYEVSGRIVTLNFKAGAGITRMALSNAESFKYSTREDYQTTKEWDLCSRYSGVISLPTCESGAYEVYATFYDKAGKVKEVVSTEVMLSKSQQAISVDSSQEQVKQDQDTEQEAIVIEKVVNVSLRSAGIIFKKNLTQSARSSDVLALQQFLNANGFEVASNGVGSVGRETNYFGSLTKKALIKFQDEYSAKIKTGQTGALDTATRDFINSLVIKTPLENLPSAVFARSFGIEDEGEDVKRLQQLLASLPDIYPEEKVTGYFGDLTEKAVQRFQLKYGLTTVDHPAYGYVGPATRAKLEEVFGG